MNDVIYNIYESWFSKGFPQIWEVSRVKELISTIRKEKNKLENTPVLSLTIDGVKLKTNLNEGMNPETYIGHQLVYPGDLVICLRDLDGPLLVGISEYYGCTSNLYVVLQFANQNLDYYNYIFKTMDFLRVIDDFSYGMRHSYNISQFSQLRLPAPKLCIQDKIVKKLNEVELKIDLLIANQQQQIEKLKEYKQSLISEVVTKGLDPNVEFKDSGIEWIEKIPKNWELIPFKLAFNLNKGISITKDNLVDEGVPVINYGEIHSKYGFEFNPLENPLRCIDNKIFGQANSNTILQKGDFVFCDTSEDLEGSGNFTILNDDQLVVAGYHTIVAKSKINFDSRYLAYLFTSDDWRFQIRSRVYGIKLFSITQAILKNISLILPSYDEQLKISILLDTKVKAIDRTIQIKKAKIDKLAEYKKSLIYEYVTGKKEIS